jgi:hypothetical protein
LVDSEGAYWSPTMSKQTVEDELSQTELAFMESLRPGEPVEVFDDRNVIEWAGDIELTAPKIGVAWIRTHDGERKMLDIKEHSVRRLMFNP